MILLKPVQFLVLALLLALIPPMPASWAAPKKSEKTQTKKNELKKFPDFSKKGKWFNANLFKRRKIFKDKVTLVYFWDYSSINCIREIGVLKQWKELYKPYGFQLVWVHAPEFTFGADPENVKAALERFQINDPVFLDAQFKLWEEAQVRSWPNKILVNEKGQIVYQKGGEGQHWDTEAAIRSHLKSLESASVLPEPLFTEDVENYDAVACGEMSPETYLGDKRSTWWGAKISNPQPISPNETKSFKDRGDRSIRGFFLEGLWTNREDYMEHARKTDSLSDYAGLVYQGREVYTVAGTASGRSSRIYVTRDDMPVPVGYRGADLKTDEREETYFEAGEPRLYYLIEGEDAEPHELKLWTAEDGVRLYSFSFSNYCLAEFEPR